HRRTSPTGSPRRTAERRGESVEAELLDDLCDLGPRRLVESVDRQRQAVVTDEPEVFGDGRGHPQAAAVFGEQVPQRLELGREFTRLLSIAQFGGSGDRENRFGQGAADRRVPGVAAGAESLGPEGGAGDADRHRVADGGSDRTDALVPAGR